MGDDFIYVKPIRFPISDLSINLPRSIPTFKIVPGNTLLRRDFFKSSFRRPLVISQHKVIYSKNQS